MRVRESLDPQTRSLSLVVGVDNPYEQVVPGIRPPLLQGTYCRVTLVGQPRPDQTVVPRHAIHGGHVYVLDGENRLRKKPVAVTFQQGEFAVIGSGLAGGETLIVADPAPAIEGMLVDPLMDDSLLKRLVADARGPDALPQSSSQPSPVPNAQPAQSGDRND